MKITFTSTSAADTEAQAAKQVETLDCSQSFGEKRATVDSAIAVLKKLRRDQCGQFRKRCVRTLAHGALTTILAIEGFSPR